MQITQADWNKYIQRLSELNKRAGREMQAYIDQVGYDNVNRLITRAWSLCQYYGEGSSALASELYDAMALAQHASRPPAVPAEPASIEEVAKAINATKDTLNMPNAVSRMVKQCASDTMVQNAKRDHAEWAWISHGDTCAFCMALASQGWQPTNRLQMNGVHAAHIHANCDCEFCIRFDHKSGIQGYDPSVYRRIYDNAPGKNSDEKINAMRRAIYQENREEILAQKKALRELHLEEGE